MISVLHGPVGKHFIALGRSIYHTKCRFFAGVNIQNARLANVRNIAIVAHIDAGKTTVTERMLFYSGSQGRIGEVDKGNTTTDFMQEEMERGITIQAAAVTFNWKNHIINVLDTPGHVDFNIEVERSLRVLEGVIGVFDAAVGVQGQSHIVLQQAQKFKIPMIAFLNKMDKANANFDRSVDSLRVKLGVCPLCLQAPIGDGYSGFEGVVDFLDMKIIRWALPDGAEAKQSEISEEPAYIREIARNGRLSLVDELIARDEKLMEAVITHMEKHGTDETTGKMEMDRASIVSAIRRQSQIVTQGKKSDNTQIVPVLCGAARRNKGVQPLLDAIVEILPCPQEMQHNAEISAASIRPAAKEFCLRSLSTALVFKVSYYSHPCGKRKGLLSYFRVYVGRVSRGKYFNATRKCFENLSQIFVVHGDVLKPVEYVPVGCIGVVFSEASHTGDTWINDGFQGTAFRLPGIDSPLPVVSTAIEPFEDTHSDRIRESLEMLCREDPSLRTRESDRGEIILQGMGDLHLEIALSKIQRLFGLRCSLQPPVVEYHESLDSEFIIPSENIYDSAGQLALDLGLRLTPVRDSLDGDMISSQKVEVGIDIDEETLLDDLVKRFDVSDLKEIVRMSRDFVEHYRPYILRAAQEALANSPRLHAEFLGAQLNFTRILVFADMKMQPNQVESFIGFFVSNALRKAHRMIVEPFMQLEVNLVDEKFASEVLRDLRQRETKSMEVNEGNDAISAVLPMRKLSKYSADLRKITKGHAHYWYKLDHYRPSRKL
ncbi:hypothetical protein XU18_2147 [Perkinsela sp. CCAP 1560/4]|nr:hypothetical protein XU18_2147 [Perkinsela sp. CCAP 1560/4]|eukprot:KNH07102.1 hypothetical protein XU18_2147 [Perkinsela sp. CCAP 1560/4]